jgi:hypothetical protein
MSARFVYGLNAVLTGAMAACLTDYLSLRQELLHFRVPTTYQPPKRRGRPGKSVGSCGFV